MNKLDHFLWGVSTAGHQTDGGDAAADTTFLEHVEPTVFKEPAGDACRSWERWEDDLNCVAEMGLNAYRFSVEWCRIEQEEGVIDQAALDHYDRLMDGCLARGIQPVLTLCHFTCPHWFAKRGSWLAPDAVDLFAAHVRRVMELARGRAAAVVTLNEPNLNQLLANGAMPPRGVCLPAGGAACRSGKGGRCALPCGQRAGHRRVRRYGRGYGARSSPCCGGGA